MINSKNAMMLLTIALCLALIVIVIAMIVATAHSGLLHAPTNRREYQVSAERSYGDGTTRAMRGRILAATAAGVIVAILLGAAHGMHPDWFGLPLALTPSCTAAAFVTTLAFWPDARNGGWRTGTVRTASLRPRTPSQYVSKALIAMPVLAAILLTVYLCVTSALAAPDEYDGSFRSIRLEYADYVSTAGPYPGSYYAVPVIAATLVLTALTVIALLRIAHAAAPHDSQETTADIVTRTLTARITTFVSAGATMCCAAGVSLFAGIATRNVGFIGPDPAYWDDAYATAGMLQVGCGIVCGIIALAMLSYALLGIVEACLGTRGADSIRKEDSHAV